MFIEIQPDLSVALRDADNFEHFKVVAPAALTTEQLAQAMKACGELAPEGVAWISPAWIFSSPAISRTTQWAEGFAKMVADAKTKGWVRDPGGSIQAHVERTPAR